MGLIKKVPLEEQYEILSSLEVFKDYDLGNLDFGKATSKNALFLPEQWQLIPMRKDQCGYVKDLRRVMESVGPNVVMSEGNLEVKTGIRREIRAINDRFSESDWAIIPVRIGLYQSPFDAAAHIHCDKRRRLSSWESLMVLIVQDGIDSLACPGDVIRGLKPYCDYDWNEYVAFLQMVGQDDRRGVHLTKIPYEEPNCCMVASTRVNF